MSRRGGERPPLSRTALAIGIGIVVACALGVGFGSLVVLHRTERCVQDVLAAQRVHLSTWEAVERCQRRTP